MNPLTIPMMVKSSSPVLSAVLLTGTLVSILAVCFLLLRHEHRTRKAKKRGDSPHTGHHGNH